MCSRVSTLRRRAKRIVLQAVHLMLDGGPERLWGEGESPGSSSIFIGRNLDRGVLLAGLCSCVTSPNCSASWPLTG